MNFHEKIIGDIECHDIDGITECFQNGVGPNDEFRGLPLIYELISEYGRGPSFKECVKTFVANGLEFEDKALLAVWSDDAETLSQLIKNDPEIVNKTYSFKSAFTPIHEATLLHICAEHNHVACAKILVQNGANVNAEAGKDEDGFGGQTPIFHTVNQRNNLCIDMLRFLLENGAQIRITLQGIIWGQGYEWETYVPAINPVSYAMMGLLRQFQRTEDHVYEIVAILMKAAYDLDYTPKNIPNEYLYGGK